MLIPERFGAMFSRQCGNLLAREVLTLDRDYTFFQLFADTGRVDLHPVCQTHPLDVGVWWYDDDGLGDPTNVDPYGEALTFITAGEAQAIEAALTTHRIETTARNRAALAYMKELAPDTRIILWWC